MKILIFVGIALAVGIVVGAVFTLRQFKDFWNK